MNEVVIIAIIFSLTVLTLFWIVFYFCFKSFQQTVTFEKTAVFPGVSVIVVYKNAENHIINTINSILNQDYPDFEVIAVNDYSIDSGPTHLSEIEDTRLFRLNAIDDKPGKKAALTEAIRKSKFDILLFTDADCIPASRLWIKSMCTALLNDTKKELVLGYGPMYQSHGLLNHFIRYETFITAFQYFSYTALKIPYMGVGRNLMYKKSLFYKINGFEAHKNISSGDDDLFVMVAASSANTTVNVNPESFVWSEGKKTLISYLHQKTRHISTSIFYAKKHKLLLSLFSFAHILFYVSWITGIVTGVVPFTAAFFVLLGKWLIQMILQHNAMKILQVSDLNKYFPLTDFMLFAYYMLIPIYGLFRKRDW